MHTKLIQFSSIIPNNLKTLVCKYLNCNFSLTRWNNWWDTLDTACLAAIGDFPMIVIAYWLSFFMITLRFRDYIVIIIFISTPQERIWSSKSWLLIDKGGCIHVSNFFRLNSINPNNLSRLNYIQEYQLSYTPERVQVHFCDYWYYLASTLPDISQLIVWHPHRCSQVQHRTSVAQLSMSKNWTAPWKSWTGSTGPLRSSNQTWIRSP